MSPHVLPRFTATPSIYRGEPVAVFAAVDADVAVSAPGPSRVPVQVRTIRTLADELGFRSLDRFVTAARSLGDDAHLAYSSEGLRFEARHTGLLIVGGSAPSAEWVELVKARSDVLVVLAAQGDSSDPDLRALTSSRRAFGGYAQVVHPAPNSSRYVLLDTSGQREIRPTDRYVFLDSNVLVHLEKAARGTSSDSLRDTNVQALAVAISHQVVLGGFAIAELSWDRAANQWSPERAASLAATVEAWFGAGSMTRAMDISSVRSAYQTAVAANGPQSAADRGPLETQIAFYVCLLKISQLWRDASSKFRAIQRVDLYETFAHWLLEDVGYNLSFPLRVAFDRLLGPQDADHVRYVDKLMKFGRQPLRELWGAGWDLAHLSNIDLSTDPLFRRAIGPHEGGVLLATDDKALPLFRQKLRVSTATRDGDYSLIFMASTHEVDSRLSDQQNRIDKIHLWVQQTTLARQVGYRSLDEWNALKRKTETEFLQPSAPVVQEEPGRHDLRVEDMHRRAGLMRLFRHFRR